nr:aminodeoxychorismate/anthranilate synthase component II [Bartonella queenslandensis]
MQGWDLIVAGPGPGNPLDSDDKRVNAMREAIIHMKTIQQPFFAVCLSHQLLCLEFGLPIIRLSPPNQGVQKTIMLDEHEETVGFYNTFCAEANAQEVFALQQQGITLYSERGRDQVHALRAPTFASVQFHIESILTIDGPRILDSFVTPLLQKNYSEVV